MNISNRSAGGTRLKRLVLSGVLLAIAAPLLALLYADELVRASTSGTMPAPVDLPSGVEIRVAPRLTRIIGASSGGASAVTIGRTIIVPLLRVQEGQNGAERGRYWKAGDTIVISPALWREVVRHERVHVKQRERYGRWYLPLYVYWYVRRGYLHHPLEEEANQLSIPLLE